MMRVYRGREAEERLGRAAAPGPEEGLRRTVEAILAEVRLGGDRALRGLSERFGDDVSGGLLLSDREVAEAASRVPEERRETIRWAARNIERFNAAVMSSLGEVRADMGGWSAGLRLRPVAKAGCYVPGGRYPLASSALMTALTARAAGVREISLASPGMRDEVVYAGTLAGVSRFYRAGGAQAVAALAFGTETVRAVDVITGPGNAYVAEAKRQVQGLVGVDMPAGPSEVAVIADAGADPVALGLDLLAQAEHSPDAAAWLLTPELPLAERTASECGRLAGELGLPGFVGESLSRGGALVLASLEECARAANRLAPEHVELQVREPDLLEPLLEDYGALFLGRGTPVPFGDYAAGPNHTLPTGRAARFCGGLSPLSFLRPQSWVRAGDGARALAERSAAFARMEGLRAHEEASLYRLELPAG